jgi:hypothetical protein
MFPQHYHTWAAVYSLPHDIVKEGTNYVSLPVTELGIVD